MLPQIPSDPSKRLSSYPYISGDTFRAFCDFVIDKTNKVIDPDKIKDGDVIFMTAYTGFLDFFFKNVHPNIKAKYILVNHGHAQSNFSKYLKYLDDDNIVAWFGQNLTLKHEKAFPIPLGLANRYWVHGNTTIMDNVRSNLPERKDILLYMNFSTAQYRENRRPIFAIFENKKFCYNAKHKPFKEYLSEIARSKFVLSPEGFGIDCYRTWESMYLGAIPIISSSGLDKLFEDLPVIIINDWKIITEEYLIRKYKEMKNKKYKLEKLFADYWFKKISEYKEKAKNKK
jgi:hypothetical protein